jgi:hypothetical protein
MLRVDMHKLTTTFLEIYSYALATVQREPRSLHGLLVLEEETVMVRTVIDFSWIEIRNATSY